MKTLSEYVLERFTETSNANTVNETSENNHQVDKNKNTEEE
ncbi:hypothetical protein [Flavobacterium sp. WV_118_3]